MEPISKKDVIANKKANIPDEVIDEFNKEIASNWNGTYSLVAQTVIANKIADRMRISVHDVYRLKYLDIETIFKDKGWKVEYDKPGYNESYEATFSFS